MTATRPTTAKRPPTFDPRLGDAVLALLATAFAVTALAFDLDDEGSTTGRSYVVAVLTGGCVAARRVQPLLVLAVTIAGRLVVAWDTGNDIALLPATAIALYTVARHGDRRSGLIGASIGAAVMGVASAALGDDSFPLELVGETALAFLPIAVADAMRTRADRIDDLIETEAEARVQAERLRIARDLHDVVAHGLSTITIQSGVAAHLVERNPGQAKEALEIINATGKQSLDELRAMVGVLRATDDVDLRPTPADPDDLAELLAAAGNAGVAVTVETTGAFPADVGDAAVVAVHRILREALTNVARHAAAAFTVVRLDHHDDHVVLEVCNDPPSAAPTTAVPSTGVGIIGMRERAESTGGHLDAGPTADGGFLVRAVVPYYRHRA